jgi:hypothetical protein
VPLGLCYDASAFSGISFWMKGDPAAGNKSVKFSIATPPTTEQSAGGTCPNADPGCYNSFADQDFVTLTPTWTHYSFTWAQLKQADWGVAGKNGIAPAGYKPETQILNVAFAPIDNTRATTSGLDDVRLEATAPGSCADVVSQQMFEGFFPARNAFYTYAGFAAAAKLWPKFCGEGSADVKKREAAAFFAHLVQETGSLKYLEEIGLRRGSLRRALLRSGPHRLSVRGGPVVPRPRPHAAHVELQLRLGGQGARSCRSSRSPRACSRARRTPSTPRSGSG